MTRLSGPEWRFYTTLADGASILMTGLLTRTLKRWREDVFFSHILSNLTWPVHYLSQNCMQQIENKVKRNGVSIRLPNGKTISVAENASVRMASALFWKGIEGLEPETSRTLRFFFERVNTFVDVGANYGFYSVLGALWNSNLRVVSFEPIASIYEGLLKNVTANRLESQVTCENVALSSESGSGTIYLPASESKDAESTATLAANSWQVRQHAQPIHIRTVRFDDYEANHPMRVDLLKIDVEDFEADVLAGMSRVVERDRPFIVCEILPRNREHRNERTRQIIEKMGYTAYWIVPSAYIRVSRFDFERGFLNFLLSPIDAGAEVFVDLQPLWEARRQLQEAGTT